MVKQKMGGACTQAGINPKQTYSPSCRNFPTSLSDLSYVFIRFVLHDFQPLLMFLAVIITVMCDMW